MRTLVRLASLIVLASPLGALEAAFRTPGASFRAEEPDDTPARELAAWVQAAQRGRLRFGEEELAELTQHIARVDQAPELSLEGRSIARGALLDLIALERDPPRRMPEPFAEDAAQAGRRALEAELGFEVSRSELLLWLVEEVLTRDPEEGRSARLESRLQSRHLAALSLLEGRHAPVTRDALLDLARAPGGELRGAARHALAGWQDEAVHDLFLRSLEELRLPDVDRDALRELETHVVGVGAPLSGAPAERLVAGLRPLVLQSDWRVTIAAVRLLAALPSQLAAPLAIEGLSHWQQRQATAGQGSLRIEHAFVDELERRSGRSLGRDPRRWALWWERVQTGELGGIDDQDDGRAPTRATFFGLRPRSDRVIFVIDRSGSMERLASYRTGRSRYEEAAEQLGRYLEAIGERARFGVVVFSDDGRRWRTRLTAATPDAISAVRRWLQSHPPDGGTYLAEGLEKALDLRPGRSLDPERIEADTLVVLCDGATNESAEWARNWLVEHNSEAELIFHCVQIGGVSAAALEVLATGSRGTFVRAGR